MPTIQGLSNQVKMKGPVNNSLPSNHMPRNILTTCSQHAHNMLTTCSQHAHNMLTTCSQHAHNMLTTCSQHAHNILTTCSQYAHNMLTTCSQHTHNILTTYSSTFPYLSIGLKIGRGIRSESRCSGSPRFRNPAVVVAPGSGIPLQW